MEWNLTVHNISQISLLSFLCLFFAAFIIEITMYTNFWKGFAANSRPPIGEVDRWRQDASQLDHRRYQSATDS